MMKAQVFAQAALLAGELDSRQTAMLEVLCGGVASALASRLREGLSPEDCAGDFVAAAALYALAALGNVAEDVSVEEFKAGDLTVKRGAGARDGASKCLERQAEKIMGPYLKDRVVFFGV